MLLELRWLQGPGQRCRAPSPLSAEEPCPPAAREVVARGVLEPARQVPVMLEVGRVPDPPRRPHRERPAPCLHLSPDDSPWPEAEAAPAITALEEPIALRIPRDLSIREPVGHPVTRRRRRGSSSSSRTCPQAGILPVGRLPCPRLARCPVSGPPLSGAQPREKRRQDLRMEQQPDRQTKLLAPRAARYVRSAAPWVPRWALWPVPR